MDERRRVAVQYLESLKRAGVREWRHVEPLVSELGATGGSLVPPVASTAQPTSQRALADEDARQWHPKTQSQPQHQLPTKPSTVVPNTSFQPLELPLAEREQRLIELKARVAACTRCQELAGTRTQTVFGVGNPQARILFIGEAPGADEDKQGEPFVGKAGQLLNDIIRACKLQREDIYICNVLRCRPPGNRLPSPQEAANCREYLDGQIAIVNPEYIVCWGACATMNLLGSTESIGKMRGKFYQYGRAKVLCTYHPSYLLRNPSSKREVWLDMQFLFRDMGIDLTAK